MQTTLFTQRIVTSSITGAKIIVDREQGNLIIGKIVGFKPYPLDSGMRMCDGTRIIHKNNVI